MGCVSACSLPIDYSVMGCLLYFAMIALQFTSSLATQPIPLKCFLQNHNVLNVFDATPGVASFYSPINSLRFDTVRANSVSFDKDEWVHDAKNVEYQGLDDSVLDDFGFNLVTNVSQITFHTDILITYPYTTSGSLFSKPINGEGLAEVFLKNAQVGMTMPFDIIEVNGIKLIELRNFNYWYNVKDNAQFSFSNLYYGNKELSDSMHSLINQKWKFLTSHFGKVFFDKVAEHVFNTFRNYMLAMPLKDFATC